MGFIKDIVDKAAGIVGQVATASGAASGSSKSSFDPSKYKPSTYESYAGGGKVSSASKRADGIATKGKTRGKIVMCGGGMYKK